MISLSLRMMATWPRSSKAIEGEYNFLIYCHNQGIFPVIVIGFSINITRQVMGFADSRLLLDNYHLLIIIDGHQSNLLFARSS